jgi:FkbM family methyltransferase
LLPAKVGKVKERIVHADWVSETRQDFEPDQAVIERLNALLPPFSKRRKLPGKLSALTGLPVDEVIDRLLVPGEPQVVPIRPLGEYLMVRPATSDVFVLANTFFGLYHLPPEEVEPLTVLDLGANIGTTMAHFATLYPGARVVGVELDPGNARLCVENIKPWQDRCAVFCGAVAAANGTAFYESNLAIRQWGFRIGEGSESVDTFSLDTLMQRFGLTDVDYVKMDIEGAESEVLRVGGGWSERVRSLKVEIHRPATVEKATVDLLRLGFRCQPDDRHPNCVVARA